MSTVTTRLESAADLEEYRASVRSRAARVQRVVRVCCGPGCIPKGAREVHKRFARAVEDSGVEDVVVATKATGCQGLCERGPIVTVDPGGILYLEVKEEDVADIFRETVLQGRVVDRLLYQREDGEKAQTAEEVPFYRGHRRVALALCGVVDPESIDDYIAADGYSAAAKALTEMSPEGVIDEITRSGLRGRGGGGFPTGRKWTS
jgi:(2Fe-2S) ferredoxin